MLLVKVLAAHWQGSGAGHHRDSDGRHCIFLFVRTLKDIGIEMFFFNGFAENIQDGKITCGEKCGLYFMASVAGFMTIVDFLTLIWVRISL